MRSGSPVVGSLELATAARSLVIMTCTSTASSAAPPRPVLARCRMARSDTFEAQQSTMRRTTSGPPRTLVQLRVTPANEDEEELGTDERTATGTTAPPPLHVALRCPYAPRISSRTDCVRRLLRMIRVSLVERRCTSAGPRGRRSPPDPAGWQCHRPRRDIDGTRSDVTTKASGTGSPAIDSSASVAALTPTTPSSVAPGSSRKIAVRPTEVSVSMSRSCAPRAVGPQGRKTLRGPHRPGTTDHRAPSL